MKLFKKLLPVLALLMPGALFAQEIDKSQNVIVQGTAGKMIVFKSMPNVVEVCLSRNGKFLMGRSEENNFGFIYEIAKDSIKTFNGSVIEVVDWNNYVTGTYALIDGKEYFDFVGVVPAEKSFAIEEASADLLTLRASCYVTRPGADFGNILIETKTGKILDTLQEIDPDYPSGGKMNTGLSMSNDAKIIAGRASKVGAPVNYAPAFWDRDKNTANFTGYSYVNDRGDRLFSAGQLLNVNGSGTKMCGEIREKACYLGYNRTTGAFTTPTYIDISFGYEVSYAFTINESGVILGTEQRSITDIYSRRPFIYFSENNRKYVLADYLRYLYGLDGEQSVPLFSPGGISDDGRLISGYSYEDGIWYSYLILLDEHQIYAPVLNLQARNVPVRSSNVEVSWQAPLQGEYTLTGYNVFRDKQKINDQPLPITQLSYKDEDVANGRHKYFVQAVYGNNVSEAIDTVSIIVMDENGCLPVQELFNKIEYNRTVSLYWGLPSERESSNVIVRPKSNPTTYFPQDKLDFVSIFQPAASRMSSGIRIGDYIYAGSYESGNIYVYDQIGNVLKEIYLDGMANIYDMTYHDGSFYVATDRDRIDILDLNPNDPFDISAADHFTTSFTGGVVSITYVENSNPDIHNGKDYLLVGDYYHLAAYPTDAVSPDDEFELPVKFDIRGMLISGIEYYKGRLYVANQEGVDGCDVVAYDMATGEKLFTTNLYEHPTVVDAAMAVTATGTLPQPVFSGGLTHSELPDGTVVLECLVQCQYAYNMLMDMELESSKDVKGYVVFRKEGAGDYKRISDTLHARHFTENIDTAGRYTYYIEYLSMRDCNSLSVDMDVTTIAEIFEKGECVAPKKMEVFESDKSAVLTWTEECFNEPAFVGFNLYRNGERIGEKNFYKKKYIDSEVELGTEYTYVLEAFYENSCVAFDTVKITLHNKGEAREPAAFKVKGTFKEDNTVDVKAIWGLPYFEEPMAYGYCGIPAGGNSLDGTSQLFCIVGWNAKDMDKFDEDLYLVGVELVLPTTYNPNSASLIKSLNAVVYVDDELVYTQFCDERVLAKEWERIYFNQVFKMKQAREIAVGYSVSYDPVEMKTHGNGVFAHDIGPRTPGKSDLLSYDGRDFGTLYAVSQGELNVNLCINALVVRLRDLEVAASAANPQEYMMKKVMRMDLDARLGKETQLADAPKTSSEGIKFLGFNIYRDGEKLNDTLMKGLSYEENVPRGEYEYEVGAVYENADEQKTSKYINFTHVGIEDLEQAYGVSVYPNPASDRLNINGAYASFMLVDMNGRVVMRDVRNTESISLAGLNDGVYFMLITLPNGDKRAVKVIKR